MKRLVSLWMLLCIMALVGLAHAQEALIRHEGQGTLPSGASWQADAEVYGSDVHNIDTLCIRQLDLGVKPEDRLRLTLFFPEGTDLERATGWTPEEVSFDSEDGDRLHISPGSFQFSSLRYQTMQYYTYPLDPYQRQVMDVEFPPSLDTLSPQEAHALCQPILDTMGMEFGEAVDVIAYTPDILNKICAVRLKELENGYLFGVEGLDIDLNTPKTERDAFYTFTIPQFINGIRIAPEPGSLARYYYQVGAQPGGIRIMMDAQGNLHFLNTDVWLDMDGMKKISTDAVVSYDNAMQTAITHMDKLLFLNQEFDKDDGITVKELHLEYALDPKHATKNQEYTAIPVWTVTMTIHQKTTMESVAFGNYSYDEFTMRVGIDARTGKVMSH